MERRFRITVDGREYTVTVEELGETPGQLYPQPGSMRVPAAVPAAPAVSAASAPAAAPGPAGAGDVASTLGGVVQGVLVSLGQDVAQGDKVVVIEAMKMKTPMIAHRAGKVVAIAVKAGDSVEAGQVLVTLG